MKYSVLKAKGTMIATHDIYDNGAFLYTHEGWIYKGGFYLHTIHSNTADYTGKTCTTFLCYVDDPIFESYLWYNQGGYFTHSDLTDDGVKFIEEMEAKKV